MDSHQHLTRIAEITREMLVGRGWTNSVGSGFCGWEDPPSRAIETCAGPVIAEVNCQMSSRHSGYCLISSTCTIAGIDVLSGHAVEVPFAAVDDEVRRLVDQYIDHADRLLADAAVTRAQEAQ